MLYSCILFTFFVLILENSIETYQIISYHMISYHIISYPNQSFSTYTRFVYISYPERFVSSSLKKPSARRHVHDWGRSPGEKSARRPKPSLPESFGCFQKYGYPQIIHFNRVFHYFYHPFWGTTIFGNIHLIPLDPKTHYYSTYHLTSWERGA